MSESSSSLHRRMRDRIIAFLVILADRKNFSEIEKRFPTDQLPYHFARIWFDELYTPSLQYLDCLKGDTQADTIAQFTEMFSDEEYAALERFHRFFELRVEMLRDSSKLKQLDSESTFWRHVAKDASLALDSFDAQEIHSPRLKQLAEAFA